MRATRSPIADPVSGLLVLYKEVGPGSQSLLGAIRKLAATKRVGHGGTLDPFASGVLPVAVGRATRLMDRLHSFPKEYVAELALGLETSTDDLEGEVIREVLPPALEPDRIREASLHFTGELRQSPPMYSAVRTGGKRAYELARQGEPVKLPERQVQVYSLEILSIHADRVTFRVSCSTGTYVRSLGRDIARALGTAGHLTRLTRTRVGPLSLEHALTLDETKNSVQALGLRSVLHSPDVLLEGLSAVSLDAQAAAATRGGRVVTMGTVPEDGTLVRGYDETGKLLACLESSGGGLRPRLLLQ